MVAPESASGSVCGLYTVLVDARLSGTKRGKSVVTALYLPFLTASLLGQLFSDMVRVVDCHAGVLGSNPGRSKRFSPWNYFRTSGKRGCSVVRHLPLVLEVPGSIPLAARKISVSEHAFSSVICRDDNR